MALHLREQPSFVTVFHLAYNIPLRFKNTRRVCETSFFLACVDDWLSRKSVTEKTEALVDPENIKLKVLRDVTRMHEGFMIKRMYIYIV
jgi:hypothetical protein